jgi:hypothetical protein
MKVWITRAGLVGLCALAVGLAAHAADHKDSASVTADPATDITDLYAFKDGPNLVVVMDVNGFSAPVAMEDFRFATDALYLFHFDSDGDISTDEKKLTVQFADKGDAQWIRVRGSGHGTGGKDEIVGRINTSADSSTTRTVNSDDDAVKIFAGPRDDPFFFSLLGNGDSYKGFTTCTSGSCFFGQCDRSPGGAGCFQGSTAAPYPNDAVDSFAGFNVSAIVIELPLSDFASTNLSIWVSTAR